MTGSAVQLQLLNIEILYKRDAIVNLPLKIGDANISQAMPILCLVACLNSAHSRNKSLHKSTMHIISSLDTTVKNNRQID